MHAQYEWEASATVSQAKVIYDPSDSNISHTPTELPVLNIARSSQDKPPTFSARLSHEGVVLL